MADELKSQFDEQEEQTITEEETPLQNVAPHEHNGNDSLRINEGDLDNAIDKDTVVLLTTNQTIAGVKTFSSIPVLPASDPTTDNQATRKVYVDNLIYATETEASDNKRVGADTDIDIQNTTYAKKKQITYNDVDGTIRTKMILHGYGGGYTTYGKVYINGVAAGAEQSIASTFDAPVGQGATGTFSDDLAVETGDTVELWCKVSGDNGGNLGCDGFELHYDKVFSDLDSGTVDLD